MATGDQNDFASRLWAVLPQGWFPQAPPILTGVLTGFGNAFATIYSLIQYVILQTRIATATGPWLDGISFDYFAGALPRFVNEADAAFSARIRANLLVPLGTRAGVIAAVKRLTGRTPTVFEPMNTGDTGGYGAAYSGTPGSMGYGVAGGYGNLQLPFEYFIVAYRPINVGIAGVSGYGKAYTGVGGVGGAYANSSGTGYLGGSVGAIEYANLSFEAGQVTDAAIQAAIANATPAGVVAWMAISN